MLEGQKVRSTKDIRNVKNFLNPNEIIPAGTLGVITKAFKAQYGWNISVRFEGFEHPVSTKAGDTEVVYD